MTKRNSEVGIKMLNAVFQRHNWSPRSVLSRCLTKQSCTLQV